MSLFSLAGLPSGSGRSGKTEAMGDLSPLWENIFKNNSQNQNIYFGITDIFFRRLLLLLPKLKKTEKNITAMVVKK